MAQTTKNTQKRKKMSHIRRSHWTVATSVFFVLASIYFSVTTAELHHPWKLTEAEDEGQLALTAFLSWLSDVGVYLNSGLSIVNVAGFGRGVVATRPIQEGVLLLEVPSSVMMYSESLPPPLKDVMRLFNSCTSRCSRLPSGSRT